MEYNEHDSPARTQSYGRLVHAPKWWTTSPQELAKPQDPRSRIHPSKTTVTKRGGQVIHRNVKGQLSS